MSKVFVVDTNKQPLDPVHPGQARLLLSQGKAAVLRRYPFTLVLKTAVVEPQTQPLRVKIDPGSKTTGLALVNDTTGEVIFASELVHRGAVIKKNLDARRAVRRSRRLRHTRYRPARFKNRRVKYHLYEQQESTWLPPSLESRVANILTWVQRLQRLAPVAAISQELIKFDTQLLQNPEVSGVLYQQGELAGYEIREYLLEKWQRRCAYCGKQNVPLQVEHITPRAGGGTDRASNLTLSCEACNLAKGTQPIEVFLAYKPEILKRILVQARSPLKDAAAVNTTRWVLYRRLKALGLPIETGSGGLTKYQRCRRSLPKTHWLDAACVGRSTPEVLQIQKIRPLQIIATGSGSRQMSQIKLGFPTGHRQRCKRYFGFQTGDIVRATIPRGKYIGTYVTRVTVRASGQFKLHISNGDISCNYRYCQIVHRNDRYSYTQGPIYDGTINAQ